MEHHVSVICIANFVLDEALTTPMIWCGYKQINTVSIQKQFSIGAYESQWVLNAGMEGYENSNYLFLFL